MEALLQLLFEKGCESFTVSGLFPFAGLTQDATRTPLHMDAHTRACICATKKGADTDRAPHSTHCRLTPRIPLNEREYWSNQPNTESGAGVQVGVCPRVRCASSEGGSGRCRASTLHTAPVKTDRRDAGSQVTLAHHSVLMAPRGHTKAKEGRFKGNESFSKHRNMEGLIAGRI